MTEYKETQVPDGDTRNDVLELLASGKPWAFIIAGGKGKDLDLSVEVGGGIADAATLRNLLDKTLRALPAPAAKPEPESERWDRAPVGTQWPEAEAEQGTASAADKPMDADLCGETYPEGWGEPADPSPCDRPAGHPGGHSNGTQSWRLVSETAHRSIMDTTDVPR